MTNYEQNQENFTGEDRLQQVYRVIDEEVVKTGKPYDLVYADHTGDFVELERGEGGMLDKEPHKKFLEIGPRTNRMFYPQEDDTIVTIDLPSSSDSRASSQSFAITDSIIRTGTSGVDGGYDKGRADYLPLLGDGRDMPYFKDGEFGVVGLRKIIGCENISEEDALQLLREALRVGEKVELVDTLSGNPERIKNSRFAKINFAEAGVKVQVQERVNDAPETWRMTLTKADNYGDVPLDLLEKRRAYPLGGLEQTEDDPQAYFNLVERMTTERQMREKKLRSNILGRLFGK